MGSGRELLKFGGPGSSDEVIIHLKIITIAVPREKDKARSGRLNRLHKIWRSDKF